jgi:hypothetical protein
VLRGDGCVATAAGYVHATGWSPMPVVHHVFGLNLTTTEHPRSGGFYLARRQMSGLAPLDIRHSVRVSSEPESAARDERQYALMRDRVAALRSGELYMGKGISDLEGLLHALDQAPEDWKDRFVEEWSVLEIAYAVALDRQQPIPTSASDHEVREALDAFDGLIDEQSPRP